MKNIVSQNNLSQQHTWENSWDWSLKRTLFKFHDKHFLQTHGIAMGTKVAVAFAVIFMAHIEKQLLAASPQKPIFWKRPLHWFRQFIPRHDQIHTRSVIGKNCFPWYWSFQGATFRCQQNWMLEHITILQKRFNIRTSLQVTLSVLGRVLLKGKLCVYWEQTRLKKLSSYES